MSGARSARALTIDYDRWLADRITVVRADVARKHAEMHADRLRFLRGTYYLWLARVVERAGGVLDTARVPLVGDLHVENFGTWRDARQVRRWGVNDLDELGTGPWLLDPLRLAVSATLAPHIAMDDDEVCDTILDAYAQARGGADVAVTEPGAAPVARTIKVNHPLDVGGTQVYLQGNGYAPQVTVKDAAGQVAFSGPVPFLPQDQVYTSRGVVKVPDVSGGQPQIGLLGFLLPTAAQMGTDQWVSTNPEPTSPLLVLSVWSGNLGLDTGVPQNVYQLDEKGLTEAKDASGKPVTLDLRPGDTVTLPNGLGTLTFDGIRRFAAFDLRKDPALGWLLAFALTALAGLATSLFVPRRRLWVRASASRGNQDEGPTTVVTAAGLARGDDVGLAPELGRVLEAVLGSPVPVTGRAPVEGDSGGD